MSDAETGLDRLRKRKGTTEAAMAFRRDADDRCVLDVESTRIDEIAVDHGVEVRIVGHVVDVPVDIIVHPARRDGQEVPVAGAKPRRIAAHSGDGFYHILALSMRAI